VLGLLFLFEGHRPRWEGEDASPGTSSIRNSGPSSSTGAASGAVIGSGRHRGDLVPASGRAGRPRHHGAALPLLSRLAPLHDRIAGGAEAGAAAAHLRRASRAGRMC
jgi:hypothetical protein